MKDEEILSEIESYLLSLKEVHGSLVYNGMVYIHSYKVKTTNMHTKTLYALNDLNTRGIDATQFLPPTEVKDAMMNVAKRRIDWSCISHTENPDGYTVVPIMNSPTNIYKAFTITVTPPSDCSARIQGIICQEFLNVCNRSSKNFGLWWEKLETSPRYHCILVGEEIKKEE